MTPPGKDMDALGPWTALADAGIALWQAVKYSDGSEEKVTDAIKALNEIEQAATACGINKIPPPPGAIDAVKSAIEALAKSNHPPHATAMSVLLRVLPVLEAPTLANEAKMMAVLGALSRAHESGT